MFDVNFFPHRIGANVDWCGCGLIIENQMSYHKNNIHHKNNHHTYTQLIKENKIVMQWSTKIGFWVELEMSEDMRLYRREKFFEEMEFTYPQ